MLQDMAQTEQEIFEYDPESIEWVKKNTYSENVKQIGHIFGYQCIFLSPQACKGHFIFAVKFRTELGGYCPPTAHMRTRDRISSVCVHRNLDQL